MTAVSITEDTDLAPAGRNVPRLTALYEGTAHVIGQEKARRQMAVLLERQRLVAGGVLPRSSGAIISGKTGTGKTYLTRAMCRLSGLPFAEVNATQYTERGYVGLNLSQMFLALLESAADMIDEHRQQAPFHAESKADSVLKRRDLDAVVELAQSGVILLDEFDKWMLQGQDAQGRNVGRALQAELLKMVEGSVEYTSDDEDELGTPFDTSRVLILCAGAFVGLPAMVLRRLHRDEEYTQDEGFWDLIEPSDFVRFGLIPELAGRLSTYVMLRELKEEHLADIMSAPGGVVSEYRQQFERYGCRWEVSPQGVRYLAGVALHRGTGARGVEHVLWGAFSEALFEAAQHQDVHKLDYHPSLTDRRPAVRYEPNAHRAWLEVA